MLGIHRDEIRVWLLRYKREGVSGLQKHPVKRADFAEKCRIVCEFVEKVVPLHKICAAHQVSRSALKWCEFYGTCGEGIEEIEVKSGWRKIMLGGSIYIQRDGKLFNATGAEVK